MTRRYPAYRDSGVEWVGPIPNSWTTLPACAVGFERNEPNAGMKEDNLLSLSYGRIVPKDIEGLDGLLPESFETYQIVHPGDIVLRLTDLQNDKRSLRSAIVTERGIITSAYVAFAPNKIDSRYLSYQLRDYDLRKVFYSMGGGLRQGMKYADIRRLPLLVPPLPEQTAIAAFLDRETAKIDALVAEQRRLIDLLKEKRQAVISHAVTRGLTPAAKLKPSGVDWLGDVPEGWTVDRFGRLVAISEGQVDPTVEPYASMILIAPNHVESGTGRLSSLETAAEQGAESGKYMFERGAVIYSKIRPGLAKVAVAPVAGLCSADMYPLTSRGKLRQDYLAWLLLSPGFTAWAALESDRVAMPKINREKLNELRLPVPSLVEQEAIVDFIVKQTASFDQLSENAEAAISLLQERRAALISAAVTGKIDVRGLVPQETEAA